MEMQFKNEKLYLAAVKSNARALKHIPKELRTRELCYTAISTDSCDALPHIPKELKTRELYFTAVEQDGWALQYIDDEIKNGEYGHELCLIAVRQDEFTIGFVPEKTPEIIDAVRAAGKWTCFHNI
jgi:hypothetical protein